MSAYVLNVLVRLVGTAVVRSALEAVCGSVTIEAAVGSMALPEGVVDEFVVGTGVGVLSTVGVFEF